MSLRHRGVGAESVERGAVVRRGRRGVHRHDAERIRLRLELPAIVVDRLHGVDQRIAARTIEPHLHDVALRRRQHDARHPDLALEPAHVRSENLDRRAAERKVERARARGVGEVEAHHLAAMHVQRVVGLAVHEQHVADPAHQREVRRLAAVRDESVRAASADRPAPAPAPGWPASSSPARASPRACCRRDPSPARCPRARAGDTSRRRRRETGPCRRSRLPAAPAPG